MRTIAIVITQMLQRQKIKINTKIVGQSTHLGQLYRMLKMSDTSNKYF